MTQTTYILYNKVRTRAALALCAAAALLTAACSDDLYDFAAGSTPADDGIQFSVSTLEQADMAIDVGRTRSAAADTSARQQWRQADAFVAHALEGDNPFGLTIHRMPLPFAGIHPHTVHAPAAGGDATRAPLSAIVNPSSTNFHDSLTIWGCVYDPDNADDATNHEFLFQQVILKKIRNWRSSAHWPYEKGKYMRFCAIAPAFESPNIKLHSAPRYESGVLYPPTFDYTLPESAGEMRDLLFGMSDPVLVDVQSGPTGTTAGDPKAENLGQDNKIVNLAFQHALTVVRFAEGAIPTDVTIKKITLHNVYTKGTLTPAAIDPTTGTQGVWSDLSTTGNYSILPNFTGTATENTYIDGDSVFFMIPHVISATEGTTLEVQISVKNRKYVSDDVYPRTPDGLSAEDATTHTLTCSLVGDVWKKGYTVTYKLTIGEVEDGYYMLAESPAAHPHDDNPVNGTFPVHSYHSYWDYSAGSENLTHAVNWSVVGYSSTEDGTYAPENKPAWLTVRGTDSGTTGEYVGGSNSIGSYTIQGQSPVKSGSHTNILKGNNASLADNLDLSWYSTNAVGSGKESHKYASQTTANCYIVNRGGYYTFPLVYGNGTTGTPSVDHLGATINHSSIRSQIEGKNPDNWVDDGDETHRKKHFYSWDTGVGDGQSLRTAMVWQDVDGIISSTDFYNGNFRFRVNENIIQPANAVVALQGRKLTVHQRKSGDNWIDDSFDEHEVWETLWTWHIWITDEVYPNDGTDNDTNVKFDEHYLNYNSPQGDHIVSITNKSSSSANILPVNLGWVPDEDEFKYYAHREVWVKLQQTEAKAGEEAATTVVKIEQHARQPLVTGTSTVYQWGRPTALPALCYIDKSERTVYKGTDFSSETFTLENISANTGDIIAQPTKLFRTAASGQSWFNTASVPAYWGSSKTVYDPCPPGFQLPANSIFTGFSRTGASSNTGDNLNMWLDAGEHGKGAYFYTSPNDAGTTADRYGQTVYIPATGQYVGNKTPGTTLSTSSGDDAIFIDASAGTVWSYEWSYENADKRGQAFWIYPDWDRNNADKPAIQLGRPSYFSTAMPIRPTGSLLAY